MFQLKGTCLSRKKGRCKPRNGPFHIQRFFSCASYRPFCLPSFDPSDPSSALTRLIEACFVVEAAGWASADQTNGSVEAAPAGSEAAGSEADNSAAPGA